MPHQGRGEDFLSEECVTRGNVCCGKLIKEKIDSKNIPFLKLQIKDHKAKKNGKYQKRLIIPATNFMSNFLKVGYKAIKNILTKNGI